MKKLDSKQEGVFAIIAAFIVLFSAMLNPIISAIIAVSILLIYAIFKLLNKNGGKTK